MTKSIRLEARKEGRVTGYWKGITTSEAQTYSYSVGISNADAARSAQDSVRTLNESVAAGTNMAYAAKGSASVFGFLAAEASGTEGETKSQDSGSSASDTISREISSTAGVDRTVTHETTCTPKDGEHGGTGLWQWVISTSDYSVSAFTSHTVSRTGKLAREAPVCNFWDCGNDECSVCKSGYTGEDEED